MRLNKLVFGASVALALLAVGCAGPEQKLGRGLSNTLEPTRLGEWRRTVEQTMLESGPDAAYTTGMVKGFNRTVARTAVGVYEVVTSPFPSYDPIWKPGNKYFPDASLEPVYPNTYTPGKMSGSTWETDSYLGFSGTDAFPLAPGSRFRVLDH